MTKQTTHVKCYCELTVCDERWKSSSRIRSAAADGWRIVADETVADDILAAPAEETTGGRGFC